MKKIVLLSSVVLLSIIIALFLFFKKTHVEFELVCKIPNVKTDFYPLAYVVFHTEKDLKYFFDIGNETNTYFENTRNINFDFKKYSYIIVYGNKIKGIYYSYKSTFWDDTTPSYSRTKGKIPIFIDYDQSSRQDSGVYFYRINHDERLRELYD